jgi:hypothetical protein
MDTRGEENPVQNAQHVPSSNRHKETHVWRHDKLDKHHEYQGQWPMRILGKQEL